MSDNKAQIYPSRLDCLKDAANTLPIWTADVGGVLTWGRAATEHQFVLAMADLMTIKKLTKAEHMEALQEELSGGAS